MGNTKTAGRVMVKKEVVKELLNEIPAFKALVSGEGSLPTRQTGRGWQTKEPQGRLMAEVKLVRVSIVRHVAGLANNQVPCEYCSL